MTKRTDKRGIQAALVIRFFRDGNLWCAVDDRTFTNLQECAAGFGSTPAAALIDLKRDEIRKAEKDSEQIKSLLRKWGAREAIKQAGGKR